MYLGSAPLAPRPTATLNPCLRCGAVKPDSVHSGVVTKALKSHLVVFADIATSNLISFSLCHSSSTFTFRNGMQVDNHKNDPNQHSILTLNYKVDATILHKQLIHPMRYSKVW